MLNSLTLPTLPIGNIEYSRVLESLSLNDGWCVTPHSKIHLRADYSREPLSQEVRILPMTARSRIPREKEQALF